MSAPVLLVDNLQKQFPVRRSLGQWMRRQPAQAVVAVDGVSLIVERGRVLGIVGESGCGKSTLARCILRLEEPDGGRVELDGSDLLAMPRRQLRGERRRMQMVFQDPYTSLNPRMTVGAAIAEAALVHGVAGKENVSAYVREMLELVGLSPATAERRPRQLSGSPAPLPLGPRC
jgi:oligopeptide transport system ATP-binding protein